MAAENGYSYRANCCEVQDPDRDPYLHAHAGFHDCTWERTYSNMKCRDLLGDFLWWLMNVPEGTRSLHVGVYCVRARHRSPAVAWIMSCMVQGLGCRSVYTEYIERQAGNWSRLCTTCSSCAWTSNAKARLAEQVEEDTRDLVKSLRQNMRLT